MKKTPKYPCPYCGKKHFTKEEALACAEFDIKEKLLKKKR
jgi:DNA-directed RNA polymerase subunit RPC12/RpoP